MYSFGTYFSLEVKQDEKIAMEISQPNGREKQIFEMNSGGKMFFHQVVEHEALRDLSCFYLGLPQTLTSWRSLTHKGKIHEHPTLIVFESAIDARNSKEVPNERCETMLGKLL